jgi:hypothetical protein
MPLQLKGVPYAGRMSAEFSIIGVWREQGWIYEFAERFQIFILYLDTDKDRNRDQQALEKAFYSFEYLGIRLLPGGKNVLEFGQGGKSEKGAVNLPHFHGCIHDPGGNLRSREYWGSRGRTEAKRGLPRAGIYGTNPGDP